MRFTTQKTGWYLLILVSVILIVVLIPKSCSDVPQTENKVYKELANSYRNLGRDSKRLRKDSAELSKKAIEQRELITRSVNENKSLSNKYDKTKADLGRIKHEIPDAAQEYVLHLESACDSLINGLNKEIKYRDSLQEISDSHLALAYEALGVEQDKVSVLKSAVELLETDKKAFKKANRKQMWKGIGIGLGTGAAAVGIIYGGVKAAQ